MTVLTPPYFVEEGDCTPVLLFKNVQNGAQVSSVFCLKFAFCNYAL